MVATSISQPVMVSTTAKAQPRFHSMCIGNSFILEAGNKIVGLDAAGERIFSRGRPGEVADFDEALETLVEDYPYRDTIVKGSGASGSGAGGSTRTIGGKKTMTRTQFDSLGPAEKAAAVKDTAIVD